MKTRREQIVETVNTILEMNIRGIRLNPKGVQFTTLPLMSQDEIIRAKNARLLQDFDNLHAIRALGPNVHPVLKAAQEDEALRHAARKLIQGARLEARIGERIGDAYFDPSVLPSPR